jgi:hypothetical protein
VGQAAHAGLKVSQIAQLLLIVLVLGAGTDYGLFLVFRVREQLRNGVDPKEAVVASVTRVGETITFSAFTVIAAEHLARRDNPGSGGPAADNWGMWHPGPDTRGLWHPHPSWSVPEDGARGTPAPIRGACGTRTPAGAPREVGWTGMRE